MEAMVGSSCHPTPQFPLHGPLMGSPKAGEFIRVSPVILSSEPTVEVRRVWECGGEPGDFVEK